MDELDVFMNETIRLAAPHYYPAEFARMREQYGVRDAMSRLVRTGDIQSGFRRLNELGLRHRTIEAAILQFPDRFDHHDAECAQWRLEQVADQ